MQEVDLPYEPVNHYGARARKRMPIRRGKSSQMRRPTHGPGPSLSGHRQRQRQRHRLLLWIKSFVTQVRRGRDGYRRLVRFSNGKCNSRQPTISNRQPTINNTQRNHTRQRKPGQGARLRQKKSKESLSVKATRAIQSTNTLRQAPMPTKTNANGLRGSPLVQISHNVVPLRLRSILARQHPGEPLQADTKSLCSSSQALASFTCATSNECPTLVAGVFVSSATKTQRNTAKQSFEN